MPCHHVDCSVPGISSSITLLWEPNFLSSLLSLSGQQYQLLKLLNLSTFFWLLFFLHQPYIPAVHSNYSLTNTFISLLLVFLTHFLHTSSCTANLLTTIRESHKWCIFVSVQIHGFGYPLGSRSPPTSLSFLLNASISLNSSSPFQCLS